MSAADVHEANNTTSLPKTDVNEEGGIAPEIRKLEKGKGATNVMKSVAYSGPLPTPQMMQQYESVMKGSSDRIFKMAEEDSRRDTMIVEIEKNRIEKSLSIEDTAQKLLFVLLLLLVAASVFFFYNGNNTAGFAFLAFPVLKEARALFSKVSGGDAKKD
ncbi:DUF2335 domain-containing protein [uncultured Fibrobacter sp.]|uniref:DUF2335 domain-containing protein n=1 Tax=uncultured Fibrobacter sp. TaxID=261512 RepID=UPI0025D7E9DA|nr:DUF2335 domain-containing protein [uncultured Fibrobacter sp.]